MHAATRDRDAGRRAGGDRRRLGADVVRNEFAGATSQQFEIDVALRGLGLRACDRVALRRAAERGHLAGCVDHAVEPETS